MTAWPFQSHILCLRSLLLKFYCWRWARFTRFTLDDWWCHNPLRLWLLLVGRCCNKPAEPGLDIMCHCRCLFGRSTLGVSSSLLYFTNFSVKTHRHCVTLVSFVTNSESQTLRLRVGVLLLYLKFTAIRLHHSSGIPLCIFLGLHCYLGWTWGVAASATCSHTVQGSHRVLPK